MDPQSEVLQAPVSVDVTQAVRARIRDHGISTAWSIADYDEDRGWLASVSTYAFGHRFRIEGPCAFYGGPYGPNAWTGDGGLCAMGAASYSHSPLPEGMVVGRYCSIGKGLRFLDFAHPTDWLSSSVAFFRPEGIRSASCLSAVIDRSGSLVSPDFRRLPFDPRGGRPYPVIEHDVWVGENVSLAMGIRIGTGAVIASGTTVTRDVPPYAIVAGVPGEVRKYRFEPALIDELLESRWWCYHFADLAALDVTRPRHLLDQLRTQVATGQLQPWEPAALTLPDDLLKAPA